LGHAMIASTREVTKPLDLLGNVDDI